MSNVLFTLDMSNFSSKHSRIAIELQKVLGAIQIAKPVEVYNELDNQLAKMVNDASLDKGMVKLFSATRDAIGDHEDGKDSYLYTVEANVRLISAGKKEPEAFYAKTMLATINMFSGLSELGLDVSVKAKKVKLIS